VGIKGVGGRRAELLQGRSESEEFPFHAEESAQPPGAEICVEGRKENMAMRCCSERGPNFFDIGVSDNCNTNTASFTFCFGIVYTNDTGLEGKTFFTGSEKFQVKEIEVFGMTD
jgi:hypothetical protein